MNDLAIGLGLLSSAIGVAWYLIGGAVLATIFGAFVLITVACGCFAAGIKVAAALMNSGADIALRAQESDDRRDAIQVQSLTRLVHEGVKAGFKEGERRQQLSDNQLPMLPAGAGWVDGDFTIKGFEEDEETPQ